MEHDITNIFDVEEVLGFEMANNLHDVLFFDPDEEHAVFHDIIGNTETLEILDCNASRLSLGSFFIFAGVFCFGLYFEVNLIQRESKRVNLIKSLTVLVTPKSSLAFSDAIQEVQVPEHESIY